MQGDVYLNHDNLNRSESDRLFIAHRGAADIDLYIAQHRKTDFLPSEITQAQLKQVAQLVDLLVEHSRSFDRCADKISKIINLDQQSFVKELQISLGPTLVSPLSTQLEAMRSVIIDGFHALREHAGHVFQTGM